MKKIVEDIRKKGVQRYTVYELDKPFPFYLLNLDNFNISLIYTAYFKYITIELRKLGYNIFFYDEREGGLLHIETLVLQKRKVQ